MNRTEVNYDSEEWEKSVARVIHHLRDIRPPGCVNLQLIQDYHSEMRACFEALDGPLYTFCM